MNTAPEGMERAALAMLRTLGAGKALLLVRQPETTTSQTGLGLSVPVVSEAAMDAVLLQTDPTGKNLLAIVTRYMVRKALDGVGATDTKETVEASMLRVGGKEYRIASVTAKRFGGVELLYEMEIEA